MAAGRTQIDELVGNDAEDLVGKKLHPNTGKQDVAAEEASNAGGSAKLPSNIKPFSLHGGE